MTKHSAEIVIAVTEIFVFWRNVFSHIGTQALRTVKHCRSLPLSLMKQTDASSGPSELVVLGGI